jgi:hypothetical protein
MVGTTPHLTAQYPSAQGLYSDIDVEFNSW